MYTHCIYGVYCEKNNKFCWQEIFVDVTLACAGKLYPAHKFVLSTCSDYFRDMFTKTPCKHPIVFMKDVSGRDLEALLDFMYRGEVNVPQIHLASLIKTAEGLQVSPTYYLQTLIDPISNLWGTWFDFRQFFTLFVPYYYNIPRITCQGLHDGTHHTNLIFLR